MTTASTQLEIRTADEGGFFTAQIACPSLDEHAAADFQSQMLAVVDRAQGNIAIALGGVGSVSSAGLSALVAIARACSERGGRCVLHTVPRDIAEIIRTTRLDRLLPMARNLDAARALLSPHRRRNPIARLLGAA